MFDPTEHPHRRMNILTGDWVTVSPHRTTRPWLGQVEKLPPDTRPQHDPTCYLCPGNSRVGGVTNPNYTSTFVFDNDFSALLPDVPIIPPGGHPLLRTVSVRGVCRVLCFSPRHDLSLDEMTVPELRLVVDTWAQQVTELGKTYTWVQLFENKGAVMGSSNPHPHGQIWGLDTLPVEPNKLMNDREKDGAKEAPKPQAAKPANKPAKEKGGKDEADEEPLERLEYASKKDHPFQQALNLLKGLKIMQNKAQ